MNKKSFLLNYSLQNKKSGFGTASYSVGINKLNYEIIALFQTGISLPSLKVFLGQGITTYF
jgi:hypothetical protein